MRRIIYLVLTVACALLFGSCSKERQVEKLREKIRFEGVEQIVPHGMSGVDAVVKVANETRHKITAEEAEMTLNYRGNSVLMLQLREAVELPKRFEGTLEISTRMKVIDPLSAMAVMLRLRGGEFDGMSVSVEAKVKAGPLRKNISIEEMELTKFLSKFALSTEELDRI